MKTTTKRGTKCRIRNPKQWRVLCYFNVVGLAYHDYSPKLTRRGTRLRLWHEPSNQHDPKALSLRYGDTIRRLGYVPRSRVNGSQAQEAIHQAHERGCEFYCYVNQHSMANPLETRVSVIVKVKYNK